MSARRNLLFTAAAGITAGTIATAYIATALLTRKRSQSAPLAGKVAVITGSSRGLGLALAEEYGRAGARLVLAARDPEELRRAKSALLARIAGIGEEDILTVSCDLTLTADAEELIARATGRFGQVDILVNNAGIILVGPVENQSLQNFRDAMDTNFFAALHTTLAVMPQMLARRDGSIVNISSIGGKVAVPHLLPYSASKFALAGFSEGLTAELRPKGVRVTTVCPGLMRTGSFVHALFSGKRDDEYRWFSLAASLPGVAASARRSARKIVNATIAGSAEITITPQAALAARLAPLSPAITTAASSLVSRFLPKPSAGDTAPEEGRRHRAAEPRLFTELGDQAIARYNEGG